MSKTGPIDSASGPADAGAAPALALAPAEIDIERRDGGVMILRSPRKLEAYPPSLGVLLRHWAKVRPDTVFLAERDGAGWRTVTYGEALDAAERLGEALLARGLSPDRPLMILSGNSIDHALLTQGAMLAGIPVAPISPAYSLISQDFAKLKHVFSLVEPGLIYASPLDRFARALDALDLAGVDVVTAGGEASGDAIPIDALLATEPGPRLAEAQARVGPDTVAKYLFTSGSTGVPKGVINSQRMLCSNQQMMAQVWPFLEETPPVLVDWLPWNHTFGGNHNFNLVLYHGGTLYIDDGKPTPDLIERTVENLRLVSPTIYFNVPAGYAQLVPIMERDEGLRDRFFRRLQMLFYAAAALPEDLWQRLDALSRAATGHSVFMAAGWGSTETAPVATTVHFPTADVRVIGLPLPGIELKFVPAGTKLEMRLRGPSIMPGYLRQPEATAAVFDDEGFYCIGDAGRFADPEHPEKGIVFDGRVAEDFKLLTGTWVNAGKLRTQVLAATSPVLQDAVITGHDREFIGIMAWINVTACRDLCGLGEEADTETLIRHPRVIARIRDGLARHNRSHSGSSMRIARVLLLAEPPDTDAGEITDKGYINQRAVLERRADQLARIYAEPPDAEVIVIDK